MTHWLVTNSAATAPDHDDRALRTRFFHFVPDLLLAAVRQAIKTTPGFDLVSENNDRKIVATRTSGIMRFVDDITVTVGTHAHGATLDVTSASRVGISDMGQNRRTILAIIEAVGIELMDVKPPPHETGFLYHHFTPHPFDEVAPRFFDPDFMAKISPDFPKMKIVKKPECYEAGTRMVVSYDGLAESLIELVEWNPPKSFTDRQLRGPFASFTHRHSFVAVENGTIIIDRIHYRNKLGILGKALAGPALVGHQLAAIFDERGEKVDRYLSQ